MASVISFSLLMLTTCALATPHAPLLRRAPATCSPTIFSDPTRTVTLPLAATVACLNSASSPLDVCSSLVPATTTTTDSVPVGVIATETVSNISTSTVTASTSTTTIDGTAFVASTKHSTEYTTVTSGSTTLINTTISTVVETATVFTCANSSSSTTPTSTPLVAPGAPLPASALSSSSASAAAKRAVSSSTTTLPACLSTANPASVARACTDCLGYRETSTIRPNSFTYSTTTTVYVSTIITSTPVATVTNPIATSVTATITSSTTVVTTIPATINSTTVLLTTSTTTTTMQTPAPTSFILWYEDISAQDFAFGRVFTFPNGNSQAICFNSSDDVSPATFSLDPQGRLDSNTTDGDVDFASQDLPDSVPILWLRNDTVPSQWVPHCTGCGDTDVLTCNYPGTSSDVFSVCPVGDPPIRCLALGNETSYGPNSGCMEIELNYLEFDLMDGPVAAAQVVRTGRRTHH